MKSTKSLTAATTLSLLTLGVSQSSALVVMLSDLTPTDSESAIEGFFKNNFSNVSEVRRGDFANYSNSLDALNGTGAYAGQGAADIFVIGRSLSSGGYDAGDADGYNTLTIPVVNMTSYTARAAGNRMGWHTGSASNNVPVAGAESTVLPAGSAIFGLAAGTYDLIADNRTNFNGLAVGTSGFGGGDILATIGADTLAAYWATGSAPGDTTAAGVDTFPGPRLLLNLDNEPNAGNNGLNDLANLSGEGAAAYRSAIGFATPLTAVPEPSTGLLSMMTLGLLAFRRRR